MENTTRREDELVKAAVRCDTTPHDLCEIIERLDAVIEEWKASTGYDTPKEYRDDNNEPE